MADYYTKFSFEISDLTDDESAWLTNVLAFFEDPVNTEDPHGEYAALMDAMSDTEYPDFSTGFEPAENGTPGLWIYGDQSGTPEDAATFVQAFLAKFRPDKAVGFEFANTCSKPRLDAFGGGAAFVTAEGAEFIHGSTWLAERINAHG
jgi:hypothetical protein